MKNNEKVNDALIEVLDHYKLREPANYDTLVYLKKRETAIYKNVLKKAGKYTLWLGLVYSFMRMLPKIGIKASYAKATIALITTILLTPPALYGAYKGTSALIDVLQKNQTINKNEPVTAKQPLTSDIHTTAKTAPLVKSKTIKPVTVYKPTVGVELFETYKENKAYSQSITRQFMNRLSKKKYIYLPRKKELPESVQYIVEGQFYKDKNRYYLYIKASNSEREEFYFKSYRFKDYSDLNKTLQKAVRELTNANF